MRHQRQNPPILATNAADTFRRAIGIRRVCFRRIEGLIIQVLERNLVLGTEMMDRG